MKLIALLSAMAAAAGLVVWQRYEAFVQAPALRSAIDPLLVARGQSLNQTVRALRQAGASGEQWQWLVLARLQPKLQRIQAGEYAFSAGLTAAQVLDQMARGKVKRYQFTLIEGSTFRELRRALAADARLKQTLAGLGEAEIAQRLQVNTPALEGRFLPETYSFVRGDSDLDVLRQAHQAMEKLLDTLWAQRSSDTPLKSREQLLTLASIVEKETGHGPERDEIAGVFIRRLRIGMKLQTDPTVIYGLGDGFDGNLRRIDLETPTPYNSYTNFGLPPTPIALPGRASLEATIRPAGGNALYFVARGDGTSSFSATLNEHQRAVNKYQLKK